MRAYEFIPEIISLPSVNRRVDIRHYYNIALGDIRYSYAKQKKPMKNFPYPNQVIYYFDGTYKFFVFNDNKKPVLYSGMSRFHDGYKTGVVAGDESIKGQGLGYKVYLAASDYLRTPLYSDSTQTNDSRYGIWEKLIKLVPSRVVVYDQRTRQDTPLNDEIMKKVYRNIEADEFDELDDVDSSIRQDTLLLKLLPN